MSSLLAALLLTSPALASHRLPSPPTNRVSAQGDQEVAWDWGSVWGRASYVFLLSDDDGQTWKRHSAGTSSLRVSGLDPCKTYIGKAAGIKNGKDGLFSLEAEGKPAGDCAPPPRPKCDNGLDDDQDGLVDLADPGCADARDDDEANVLPSPSDDPVVTIAGDIAGGDSGTNDEATADVIERIKPTRVLTAGDNAYEDGSLAEFKSEYDPSWGRFKSKTWPTLGNHDSRTASAAGYFDYFNGEGVSDGPAGERGKGYYARDLGNWRLYGLNTNIDASAGSAQEQWLRDDLAANAGGKCVMAYLHHPLYNSGAVHGPSTRTRPLWQALDEAGADVVVQSHEHLYERFAPQDANGNATAQGIRGFTVGTGGGGLYDFGTPAANSEVRNNGTHGVLKLALHASSYGWKFEPVAGQSFTDEGAGDCH